MNLRKMKILNIIVGVIVLCVFFLILFLIIEYSTLSDDLKFILLFSFCFLIILFLRLYEISFCRKGIKKFDSSLIDKNIRKRLMNYFLKENFIRGKYNDDIGFYENKERSNMIFRSYVADLKIDNKNEMDIKLIELFDKIIDDWGNNVTENKLYSIKALPNINEWACAAALNGKVYIFASNAYYTIKNNEVKYKKQLWKLNQVIEILLYKL